MKSGRGGVEYEDVRVGEGPPAERGCVVEIRYDLFLNRGEKVQESQVCSFRIGERNVIPGLEYGSKVCARVGPDAVLGFRVALLRLQCVTVGDA